MPKEHIKLNNNDTQKSKFRANFPLFPSPKFDHNITVDDLQIDCVVDLNKRYRDVELCLDLGAIKIPFARIILHYSHGTYNFEETFESAKALGEEIVRRWNVVKGMTEREQLCLEL
jgi:hypothetical protein